MPLTIDNFINRHFATYCKSPKILGSPLPEQQVIQALIEKKNPVLYNFYCTVKPLNVL